MSCIRISGTKAKLAKDVIDDGFDQTVNRHCYRIFARVRRLEGSELALQQTLRHEMVFSQGEAACDQFLRAVEKDDADIGPSMDKNVAIGALQRGAGDHGMLAGLADLLDLIGDRSQPGPAIFIG